MVEALDQARDGIGRTQNMGRSGDERDLFVHLDRLSQAVVETYPQSLCFSGCGRCCHYPTGFFDISYQEWELLRRHMEAEWSPERRERWLARFWREHGPRMWRVRCFEWLMSTSLPLFPTRDALPLACPFLEEGRCSVYAARPFVCRTFGHFSAKLTPWSQPHVYACSAQGELLEGLMAAEGPQVMLPDLSPWQLRKYAFISGKKRVIASWIARTYPRNRRRWFAWLSFNREK
ncbi:Flagellin N-methylase [compost metagenome]